MRIPPHIIQDAIAATPRSFTVWGRDGVHRMQVVLDKVYYGPGPTCTYFMDPETGERRMTRRGDPGLTAKVCDTLENIDYVMSLGLIDDVTAHLAPVYEFAEMLANTGKPVLAWGYAPDNVQDIYRIALAVAGSEAALRERPFFGFFATYQSPLVHTEEDIANVLWAVEHDIPVIFIGGGCAGTTAPITGAGNLVIYLAGALSGLAVMQLKKRGAAVCIGGVPEAMDLRTARPPYGGPEMSLFSAACADISRYLGLAFMGTAGASEAKTLDLQAAIESTVQTLLSGLSGATLVHDVGFLDCAQIGSLEIAGDERRDHRHDAPHHARDRDQRRCADARSDRPGGAGRRVHVAGSDGQALPCRDLEPDADGPPAVGRVGGGREQDRDRSHPRQAEEDPGAAHAARAAGGRGREDRGDLAGSGGAQRQMMNTA